MTDKIEFSAGYKRSEWYSEDELLELAAGAESDYKEMMAFNRATRDSMGPGKPTPRDPTKYLHYTFQYWSPNNGRWSGNKQILLESVAYQQHSYGGSSTWLFNGVASKLDDADVMFQRVLRKNQEFLRRIKKQNFKSADYFTWPIETKVNGVSDWSAKLIYKNIKSACDRCEVEINPDRLILHQRTVKCTEDSKILDAKRRGFEWTRDPDIMKAIRAGLIVGEAVPVEYKIFAPKWVIAAAETFKKNPEGYAGLTFEEYINGMKEAKDELPGM